MEGIGCKSSFSMPAGGRREKKKVACSIVLCPHQGSKLTGEPSPCGRPRKKWSDLVKRDMNAAQIDESRLFEVALHRWMWHTV